jgi:hypothetical protein
MTSDTLRRYWFSSCVALVCLTCSKCSESKSHDCELQRQTKMLSSALKNDLAYYNAGVVVTHELNSELVRSVADEEKNIKLLAAHRWTGTTRSCAPSACCRRTWSTWQWTTFINRDHHYFLEIFLPILNWKSGATIRCRKQSCRTAYCQSDKLPKWHVVKMTNYQNPEMLNCRTIVPNDI